MSEKIDDAIILFVLAVALLIRIAAWPFRTLGNRAPLALPALVLSAVAILIADTLFESRVNYHLLGFALAICIISTAAMAAKMLTPGTAPELVRADHKVNEPDWFRG